MYIRYTNKKVLRFSLNTVTVNYKVFNVINPQDFHVRIQASLGFFCV